MRAAASARSMADAPISAARPQRPTAPERQAPPPAPPSLPLPPRRRGPTTPPVSDGERTVLLELRQRRQELDARETALAARESLLAAAEQKLYGARRRTAGAAEEAGGAGGGAHRSATNASWQGLVKLYEAMKPRDAATIFNELEMPVLLQVVDRMKEAKAAPVLAAMQPDKARDVTARARADAHATRRPGRRSAARPAAMIEAAAQVGYRQKGPQR